MAEVIGQQSRSLAEMITEIVEDSEFQLPPLPQLVIRLQGLLADDDVDAKKVADLVHSEPAVAASMLRIANSAAFGGLSQVHDLKQAIARLGLKQVASIVTALQVKGLFSAKSKDKDLLLRQLWDHAVTTAFAARRLALNASADAEQAFLAGLLHDCGKLLVLKAADRLEEQGIEIPPESTLLGELMDTLHTKLGYSVLSKWNLADPIPHAALHHEDELEDGADTLLLCVQAGDVISKKLGFHPRPEPELSLLQETSVDLLGLGDLELATLMVDLEDELDKMRRLFR